jgi:exodeoxyribonuclease VII large subunit
MQPDLLETGNRKIYTVSELNESVRRRLEQGFGKLWLEGEISNLATPASGHLYFTLKDSGAQVRCALFRGSRRNLDFTPQDGQHVVAFAKVSMYEPRGEYQLVVEQLEEVGSGLLRRQFEQLKERLHKAGLFAAEHKQALPRIPMTLGVITSPTGAALRDVVRVFRRRAPWLRVVVFPSRVQGADASAELAAAVTRADRHGNCDLLLLVRGGGSLEDLWAFNDERLAQAIFACGTPLISGVGHEIDFTIADFVADLRAATPSAAAEMATPDVQDLRAGIDTLLLRLVKSQRHALARGTHGLQAAVHRLRIQHPVQRLQQQAQRRDELELRLHRAMQARSARAAQMLASNLGALRAHHPGRQLPLLRSRLQRQTERLRSAMREHVAGFSNRLQASARTLDAVSPLATLARGYAILHPADNPTTPIVTAGQVRNGDLLHARLAEGGLRCRVEGTLDLGKAKQ